MSVQKGAYAQTVFFVFACFNCTQKLGLAWGLGWSPKGIRNSQLPNPIDQHACYYGRAASASTQVTQTRSCPHKTTATQTIIKQSCTHSCCQRSQAPIQTHALPSKWIVLQKHFLLCDSSNEGVHAIILEKGREASCHVAEKVYDAASFVHLVAFAPPPLSSGFCLLLRALHIFLQWFRIELRNQNLNTRNISKRHVRSPFLCFRPGFGTKLGQDIFDANSKDVCPEGRAYAQTVFSLYISIGDKKRFVLRGKRAALTGMVRLLQRDFILCVSSTLC